MTVLASLFKKFSIYTKGKGDPIGSP